MNKSDRKKLEEAKRMSVAIYLELPEPVADDVASKVRWLIAKVEEQNQEIEHLQDMHRTACNRARLQRELREKAEARVKELEQELLWAADACEKAENLLAEKEKV